MASLSHAQAAVADPVVQPRRRAKPVVRARRKTQARARGGILWIANSERTKLRAENAALESQLSAQLRSGRIQAQAVRQFGLSYQDPAQYGYVNLAK